MHRTHSAGIHHGPADPLACPTCHRRMLSIPRKLTLGPLRVLSCPHCGARVHLEAVYATVLLVLMAFALPLGVVLGHQLGDLMQLAVGGAVCALLGGLGAVLPLLLVYVRWVPLET